MTGRVLVTGASGFIGPWAVRGLVERGFEVHTAGLEAGPGKADLGVTFHAADLLTPGGPTKLIEEVKPTHLLHMAWYAVHGKFWTAPQNLDWVRGSIELARAFAAHGGERLVCSGSCAEYDWSHTDLDERATPTKPHTLYGVCKDGLRSILEASAPALGVSFAWGRVFFLYGPGEVETRLVPAVIANLLRGDPAELTHGRQERDFMHVADVGGALAALTASEVSGPVNIATGRCEPLATVATMIGEAIGRPDLIRLGAREAPANDPPRLAAKVDRLLDEVGYRPRHTLEDGIGDTIAWWRERLGAE